MAKYDIQFTQGSFDDLAWFRRNEQNVIRDEIKDRLGYEPTVETRGRKLLRPNATAAWELKIGDFRVFYDVDETARLVAIVAVAEKKGSQLFFQGEEREL